MCVCVYIGKDRRVRMGEGGVQSTYRHRGLETVYELHIPEEGYYRQESDGVQRQCVFKLFSHMQV